MRIFRKTIRTAQEEANMPIARSVLSKIIFGGTLPPRMQYCIDWNYFIYTLALQDELLVPQIDSQYTLHSSSAQRASWLSILASHAYIRASVTETHMSTRNDCHYRRRVVTYNTNTYIVAIGSIWIIKSNAWLCARWHRLHCFAEGAFPIEQLLFCLS